MKTILRLWLADNVQAGIEEEEVEKPTDRHKSHYWFWLIYDEISKGFLFAFFPPSPSGLSSVNAIDVLWFIKEKGNNLHLFIEQPERQAAYSETGDNVSLTNF